MNPGNGQKKKQKTKIRINKPSVWVVGMDEARKRNRGETWEPIRRLLAHPSKKKKKRT